MAGFLPDELEDGLPGPPDDISLGNADSGGGTDDGDEPDRRAVDLSDPGPLLSLKPDAACKYALKLWNAQNRTMNRRKVRWKANYLRRIGVPGVRLIRTDYDRSEYTVWAPPGGSRTPPVVNKAARLCRRVADNLFSDPPVPAAEPASDSDEDRAAAEFATRALTQEGSESGYNNLRTAREAFDKASIYGSGFRRYWIDPNGAGHRTREILASKNATELGDGEETPLIDPQTGLEDPNPIKRYVAKDGQTLTDDPEDAQLVWVEKIKCEVLTGQHVRLLPETVTHIGQADGCMVGAFLQWAHVKNRFPDAIAKLSDQQVRRMAKYRPEQFRDLLPDWMIDAPIGTKTEPGTDEEQDQPVPDDAFVFVMTVYYKAGPQYPMGCYFVLGGATEVLHREEWIGQNADGVVEPLDIPLDQFRQFMEGHDDPYGIGLMDLLGPENEIWNAQWGSWIEHLDRFNNRKWFIPINSLLQPKAMQQMTGTFIPVNPGGEPYPETVPEYPKASVDLLDRMTDQMNDESGLQQAAQGLEVPEIKSGVQANYTVEQANKALAEIHQNAVLGLTRGWRIVQQQIRTGYTTPRKLRYLGEDNAWKEEEWTGSDLGSTRDVVIQEGSFTMQTPSQKATVASQYAQSQVLTPDQYKEVVRTQIQPLLAVQDDPHLLRIRRQITVWKRGPSKQLKQQAALAQIQSASVPAGAPAGAPGGQPGMAPPANGGPPPDPLLQAAAGLFARLPIDLEPQVAVIRHQEMARTMAGSEFSKQPPSWQTAFVNEYQAMRSAAGVSTLQEQSQNAANQANQAMLLKEIPQIVAKANVDATNVMQFEQAARSAYTPTGQPIPPQQPAQPAQGAPPQGQQPPNYQQPPQRPQLAVL